MLVFIDQIVLKQVIKNMKKEVKLLLIATTTLGSCIASYVFFYLVSWKLLAGLILSYIARVEYENLMRELAKHQEEDKDEHT